MKKLMIILLGAVTALGCLLALAGCNVNEDKLPEFESGYFRYAVRTEKDGAKKAYLVGLTETGLEQTELIYPKELDGIKVYSIGYRRKFFPGSKSEGDFDSTKLEKFYFPYEIQQEAYNYSLPIAYTVEWVKNCNLMAEGSVLSFNLYRYYFPSGSVSNNPLFHRVANVSYMYNYDENPNDGYYWVDSFNESVIYFIPPDPTRDGYNFGGWYKEKECINKWDFAIDTTGKELVIDFYSDYKESEGTNLYAKWERK